MLLFAVLGIIFCIFTLLWKTSTKSEAMPVKGEDSLSGCGSQAAEEDIPTSKAAPRAVKHSLLANTVKLYHNDNNLLANGESAGSAVKPEESDRPQATQKPLRTTTSMQDSGPETRERLKFIIGASEDNSSDEETVVKEPPNGAAQPIVSTLNSEQESTTVTPPSSSIIK